ncbi:MAG: ComEC/Rec2 family competence protein [Candidatus Omnitrophica bacterium]|nr:ComEC/Rec2 family competence protein [Candidatus Omnitrophota bacterium]
MSALIIGLMGRRSCRLSVLALVLLWTCVGMARALHWSSQPADHIRHLAAAEPAPAAVHGVVVDDPTEAFSPNKMVSEVEPEPERQVCVVAVRHVRLDRQWRPAHGLIRARVREPRRRLAYGDEVLLEGRWSTVRPPGNPGQYDWRAALSRQQIHALLAVEPYHGVVRLQVDRGRWWFRAIYTLRHRLEVLIDTHFSDHHAGLLRSFLLGQRVALDEDLKWAFVASGTMHLVVISGFNVGLIAVGLEFGLRLLGLSRRPRLIGSAIALCGYCVLTGLQPPVMRATVMAWIVLGARWLDRVINWPNALAAAALAILWWNPGQVFDPGFQLSFGAVASLLALTARLQAFLEPAVRLRPEWLRRYVSVGIASTVAIWIGLWPVLAWYFHLVSPVSILANLILVPLVSLLVGLGTAVLLLGAAVSTVVGGAAPLLACLLEAIVACVQGLSRIPGAWWPVGHPSWALILGYYLVVILTLLARRLRMNPVHVLVCWLVALNVWWWGLVAAQAGQAGWLEVTVLDVGHGDSLVIRTPSRQTLLVDAGTEEAGRFAVVPFLRYKGWHTLDALILTHFDEDHAGGAAPLLRALTVRRLFTNGSVGRTRTAREVLAYAKALHIPQEPLTAGMRLTGDAELAMLVLHPPPGFVPGTEPSSNDNSVVMRLAKGDVSALLCADLETHGLPWVMRWGSAPHRARHSLASEDGAGSVGGALSSTVLKVPHHGSALGPLGAAFVEQVHPATAVISVGRRRGFPSEEVMEILERVGAHVLLTRRDGAVTIRTDGRRVEVHTFRLPPSGRAD